MSYVGRADGNLQEWALAQAPREVQEGANFKFVLLSDDGQQKWEDSRPNRRWSHDLRLRIFDAPSPRRAREDVELEIHWPSTGPVDVLQMPSAVFHAFHWPFQEIGRRAAEIAAQGFDAVQLSPAQRSIPGDQWWTRYQPVRYEDIHGLGSEEDLRAACASCAHAGLKVFGDLVFNHMKVVASCDEWRRAQHDHGHLEHLKRRLSENLGPTFNRHDFQWPWKALEGEGWDGPDRMEGWGCGEWSELKGGSEKVMAVHTAHMEKLKACGVSGFRFDAAKHMRPEHIATYVSRAGVYAFGEVLSIDPKMQKEYVEAVSVSSGLPLPTTDFLLPVWLRSFLERGPDSVDVSFEPWVQHLLDVEFGRKTQPPPNVGSAARGGLQAPVLANNSIRFARNHDTVCNDVAFYGLGGWKDGAEVAAAWLLAVHDGTVLLLADDVRHCKLLQKALSYRKSLRSRLAQRGAGAKAETKIRVRLAADGGAPLTVCIACYVAGEVLGFCVLNPHPHGAAEFTGSACLASKGGASIFCAEGDGKAAAVSIQSSGQLQEALFLAPRSGAFFLAE